MKKLPLSGHSKGSQFLEIGSRTVYCGCKARSQIIHLNHYLTCYHLLSRPRGRVDDRSYFEDSSDDEDEENVSNTFVVIGKIGCGSTASVYACAQELGYKVFVIKLYL